MHQFGVVLRNAVVLLCAVGITGCVTLNSSGPRSQQAQVPVVWGVLSNPSGCVIFREYRKTKIGFFVVAVAAKSYGELEVVESDGYQLPQNVWVQNQESMDELQRLAQSEGLRYVKIRDKYHQSELAAARELCREVTVSAE